MSPEPAVESREPPPCRRAEALRYWLRLGFISFGGPAGQIAIMHEELVERAAGSRSAASHALNYCMVLPGPEAQQLATHRLADAPQLGRHRRRRAVRAALAVHPGRAVWVYMAYGNVPVIAGLFYGIKPAVTALVVHAAWRVGSRALEERLAVGHRRGCVRGHLRARSAFPLIVLGAGLIGHAGGRPGARQVSRRRAHGRAQGRPPGADRRSRRCPRTHASAGRACAGCCWCASRCGAGAGRAGGAVRLAGRADADGLVLHQGRAAHLRRRLCGAALRVRGARSSTTSGWMRRR